jgi:hypothetical protein
LELLIPFLFEVTSAKCHQIEQKLRTLFDTHIVYVLPPVVIQTFTSPTLYSLCSTFIVLSCDAHSSFTMSINPGVMAVQAVGAHKFTGRKQSVSCCLFLRVSIATYISNLFFICLASMDSGGRSVVQARGSM